MWLAYQLRKFGITSRTLRFDGQNVKGYTLTDFAESFARFLDGNNPKPDAS